MTKKRPVARRKQARPRNAKHSAVAQDVFDALLTLYEDPRSAGSFGGNNKLLRAAKDAKINVNREQVRRFLAAVPAYGIHRSQGPKRFERRAVISYDIDWLWEIDVTYMDNIAAPEANDGYAYLLVKIDVLSKQLAVEPLRSKTAEETLQGLRRICERAGNFPARIASDGGKEFNNAIVKSWAEENGIRIYFLPYTDQGAPVVERVIETFKIRLVRSMTTRKSDRYIDALQDVVAGYNASYHSSIGMAPSQVTEANVEQVRARLYPHKNFPRAPFKFAVGDKVRRAIKRKDFHRGFFPQFSEQVYVVARRLRSAPAMYRLAKLDGTPVTSRSFYESQLLLVQKRHAETFNEFGLEEETEDEPGPSRPSKQSRRNEASMRSFGLEDEENEDDEDEAGPSARPPKLAHRKVASMRSLGLEDEED